MIENLHRGHRRQFLMAVLACMLALSAAPAVTAQDSHDVVVTAAVDTYLTLRLCDLTANFGSGLTPLGTAVTGTNEVLGATSPGVNSGAGVFYVWQPGCPGEVFLNFESNITFDVTTCATENEGSSADLRIDQGDLVFRINSFLGSYEWWSQNAPPFQDCAGGGATVLQRTGHSDAAVWYGLRVDDGDEAGTFVSTTTWSVVAA